MFRRLRRDHFGYLGEEWMQQVGNDEAESPCAAGDERARGEVRLIVELPHPLQDASARFGSYVGVIAQNLGNRYNRKTQIVSDVFQAGCHSTNLPYFAFF